QPAGRLGAVRAEGARVLALPAVFGLSALAILVYGQFESLNTPAVVLATTRIEARPDALTSVGNRRKLMLDLDAMLEARTPGVLMLLDLDGFKAYNDTFGHP